jgi:hypothetical protein
MVLPHTIREINTLTLVKKTDIYRRLLPSWLGQYGLDFDNLTIHGVQAVEFRCPAGSRSVEITVHRKSDVDPIIYFHMADTFNNQLLVLLAVVNDPTAQRFDVDRDDFGNPTHFGTTNRNLKAEESAFHAGLAPGQVRRGLRVFRQTIPLFESFVADMGHDIFLIEPLAYHNAISFERYGFSYMRGWQEMLRIHEGFLPGGEWFTKLEAGSVFRSPEAANSIRKRAWAIHDGILGHPFTGFQMYKRIGAEAGLSSAPGVAW